MYCTKCGRKGFPVRIACLKCNATLPEVPPAFETPEERAQPRAPAICQKCGAAATDARIACLGCDQSFPRPFSFSDLDAKLETDPNIAYYVIASVGEGACDACRELDGIMFTRARLPDYRMPIKTCKNPICWCQIMGTYWDTGGAADIVAFLEHSGGVATSAQIEAHIDAQLAPERKEREREHANVELWHRAYLTEKESPERSIPLYHESIQAWKTILTSPYVGAGLGYLEDSYNRLTLTLEKLGRFPEALREIDGYRAFCLEKGRNTLLNTIVKREARLKKKVLRSS